MKKLMIFMAVVIVLSSISPTAFASSQRVAANPPKGLEERVMKALEANTDTRGWLYIPGTRINSIIVQDMETKDDNGNIKGSHFYHTHNFNRQEAPFGTPYIDYRCRMRLGAMPRNTIIYGKSDTDDPNGGGFAQLKKYLDDDWAEKHPYIYYSDGRKTYTFLVFAVFTTHENLPYNRPDLSNAEMREVLATAQELSVREYGNQPSDTARILTLSTSVQSVDPTQTYWEPRFYRFVVMAKAVVPKTA